jgi:glycosyltransferase 2 family protein
MLVRIARIALGLVVLALLIYFGALDPKVLATTFGRPDLLALATLLLLTTIPLAAFRWWLLLKSLKFPMGFNWSLRTTFTSQFFNTFLPGSYGGDFARVALAYRASGGGLSRLAFTVVVDRLSGLLALIILGLSILPLLPMQYRDATYPLFAIGCGVILGGTIFGFLIGERIAAFLVRLPWSIGVKLAHVVREVLAAVRAFFDHWPILVAILVLSIVQFTLVLGALAVLGRAMRFDALSLSGYAVAGVWSTLANALPLSPGGLGVGEAAFAKTAMLLESVASGASYATVFLAMRVLTILIAVLGVLPYWAQRHDLDTLRGSQ